MRRTFAAQLDEVAGVEADAPERLAQGDGAARAVEGVVGVDEVDGGRAEQRLEARERLGFAGEALTQECADGAEDGDAVLHAGEDV